MNILMTFDKRVRGIVYLAIIHSPLQQHPNIKVALHLGRLELWLYIEGFGGMVPR